jgi:hypothetical protein
MMEVHFYDPSNFTLNAQRHRRIGEVTEAGR